MDAVATLCPVPHGTLHCWLQADPDISVSLALLTGVSVAGIVRPVVYQTMDRCTGEVDGCEGHSHSRERLSQGEAIVMQIRLAIFKREGARAGSWPSMSLALLKHTWSSPVGEAGVDLDHFKCEWTDQLCSLKGKDAEVQSND